MWGSSKENIRKVKGVPQEDPNDPSGGGNVGDGRRGPRGHRGQRGRTGPPGRDGAMGPIGPVGLREFPEGDGLSTTGVHSLPWDWELPPTFNANFEYHWHGKFSTLSRRISESCDAISTKCESKHSRTP